MKTTFLKGLLAVAAIFGMAATTFAEDIPGAADARAGDIGRHETASGVNEWVVDPAFGIYEVDVFDSDAADWDSQFFIVFADNVVSVGTPISVQFEYRKTEGSGTVQFCAQGHADPHAYVNNDGWEMLEATEEWQTYEGEFEATGEIRTFGVNASMGRENGTLQLRNILIEVNYEVAVETARASDVVAEVGNYKYTPINATQAILVQVIDNSITSATVTSPVEIDGSSYAVTKIGANAFKNCTNLESISLPNSVTAIENSAFEGCSSLEGIDIPSNVSKIGKRAFAGCSSLTEVAIPSGVTAINDESFSGCSSLSSITLPDGITSIGQNVFNGCTSLMFNLCGELPNTAFYLGSGSDLYLYLIWALNIEGEYEITDQCKVIASGAFANNHNLTSVIIPEEVEYMGGYVFDGLDVSIKCKAMKKPAGWNSKWNYDSNYGSMAVTWAYGKPVTYFPTDYNSIEVDLTGKEDGYVHHIYDDGGPDGNYTSYAEGFIQLQAAEGKKLLISGSMNAYEYSSQLQINNRVSEGTDDYYYVTIGSWSGAASFSVLADNYARLYFYGYYNYNGSSYTGVDITAKVLPVAAVEDGFAYADEDRTILIAYTGSEATLTIPSTVTTIKGGVFNGQAKLVMIPATVTTVEEGAFNGMTLICAAEGKPAGWNVDWAANCSITWGSTEIPAFVYNITGTSPKTVELVSCNSTDENIVIPETVEIGGETYTVTNIASQAFADNTTMTAVTIPSGITNIVGNAFNGCDNLATVNFNATYCWSLGNWETGYAFANNSNITTVNFGENVHDIPEYAFYNCSGITSVNLPNSVVNIGNRAFSDCYNLESVTLGNSVSTINSYAFSYCSNIASVTLPNTVTYIGDAFCYCSITSVDIPASVIVIGNRAFSSSVLTAINVNSENNFFKSVDGVLYNEAGTTLVAYPCAKDGASFVVPETVTTIGGDAFYYCQNLKSVTLGSNVEEIEFEAFYHSGLTEITIPASVTSIGSSAFSSCYSLQTVNYNATNCEQMGDEWTSAFYECSNLKNLNIGDNVESIPERAFQNCYSLDFVQIPSTVEAIGSNAFYNVKSIAYSGEAEDVDGNHWGANKVIRGVIDGDFAYADNTKKVLVAYLGYASDVAIPSTVETIGVGAFQNNTTLVSISIPTTVTTISNDAFNGCSNLASVRIPNSVTSIGNYAFYGCGNMQIATIPQSVVTIGYYAFPCNGQAICEAESKPEGWDYTWRDYCDATWNTAASDNYGTVDIVCTQRVNNVEEELPTSTEYVVEAGAMVEFAWDNQFFISLTPEHALVEGEKYRFSFEVKAETPTNVDFAIQGQADNGDFIMWNVFGGYQTFTETYNTYNYIGTVTQEQAGIYCFAINLNDYPEANTYYFRNIVFDELYIPERDEFEYEVLDAEQQTAYITRYSGKGGDVVVPSTVTIEGDEYTVTAIGSAAFQNSTTLKSVSIPNTITEIGDNAFSGCRNMTAIDLPSSLTTIGEYAFYNCKKLASIVISASVESIGSSAFQDCEALATVDLSNATSLTTIGDNAFYSCDALTAIDFSNTTSLSSIYYQAFYDCPLQGEVFIPGTVAYMGNYVFSGCADITNINCEANSKPDNWDYDWNWEGARNGRIPTNWAYGKWNLSDDGVLTVLECFENNSPWSNMSDKIMSVVIEDGVSCVGNGAFYNCKNLTSIDLPNSVTSIGNSAFSDCISLTSITLGENVETIGNSAFSNCENLTSIELPNSVTTIGGYAFYGCKNLSSIDLPNSVTTIEGNAFSRCGIRAIFIPNSVTTMDNWVFSTLNGTMTIFCQCTEENKPDGWEAYWHNWQNVVWGANGIPEFTWATNTYEEYNSETGAYEVHNVATLTGYYGSDADVEIPATVTIDGTEYTVTTIGDNAFMGNNSVETINIPATVSGIGYRVFGNCQNLTEINVAGGNTNYVSEDGVLYSADKSTLIAYPAGKDDNKFDVPEDVYYFSDYAFEGCNNLEEVSIPEGNITNINGGLFRDCHNLQTISIPVGVTSINDQAFYNCHNLQTMSIPAGVTSIGYETFYNCESLETIAMPGVTSISGEAFYNCESLKSVTFSGDIYNIGWSAFSGCASLTEITIPASVSTMGDYVFNGCNNTIIYCEVSKRPNSWDPNWNSNGGKVVWGEETLPEFVYEKVCYDGENIVARLKSYNGTSTTVTIPSEVDIDGVSYPVVGIGNQAFRACQTVTKVVLPASVTTIEYSAFNDCNNLKEINLDAVTYIGESAFYNCGFTELELPASASIDGNSFNWNYDLQTVVVPATTMMNGWGVFNGSNNATIYCLAASQPESWNSSWSDSFSGNIIWNAKKVTLAVNDNTLGTVSGAGYYAGGSQTTVTATPNVGCSFTKWSEATGAPAEYTIVVNNDITLTAIFAAALDGYKVTVVSNNEDYGNVTGNGVYAYDAQPTLTATPADGYSFAGWYNGDELVSEDEEFIYIGTSDITLTAVFEKIPVNYGVYLNINGSGDVYVSVDGAEPVLCNNYYNQYVEGTELTFSYVASTGYYFWSWNNGEANDTYSFTVDSYTNVYAYFKPYEYEITAAASNNDYGSVTGGGTYTYGQSVELTATPAEGYQFDGWNNGYDIISTDATYTFSANGDIDLTAEFSIIQCAISVASANSHGSVDGGTIVDYHTSVTLTASPSTGYHFAGWFNGEDLVSEDDEYTFMATESLSLTAHFEIDVFNISAEAANTHGTVDGESGEYEYNTNVAFVAVPDEGYHFAGWYDGTNKVSDNASYSFHASEDISLTAAFEINSYAITIQQPENGSISGAVSGNFDYGTVLNLTASPDDGYRFVRWTDNYEEAEYAYTVKGDATISAVFAENDIILYTISATAEHGTVSGTGTFALSETTTLTAEADPNYEFVGWSDGVKTASRTVVATQNQSFEALFEPVKFTITVIADHGTVTGGGECAFDSEVTLTVEPDYGYLFTQWSDGETEPSRTFTVDGPATFTAEFEEDEFTVTLVQSENGTITGDGVYKYKSTARLKANPNSGYKLLQWSDGNTSSIRDYVVEGDVTLSATFTERGNVVYTISATAVNGTVEGTGTFVANEEITLTAVPNQGYKFDKWSDGVNTPSRQLTVTQSKTFTAEFVPETYTIVANASVAEYGTVVGGGEFAFGRNDVELTATAAKNYHFVRWTDGVLTASRIITVEGNATYTAVFEPDMFTVSTAADNGIVNGGGLVAYNSNVTLQAVANAGYRFSGWADDEDAPATRVVTVTSDTTFTANFDEISEYFVSVVAENGRIEGVQASYAPGATATVTAIANEHYHFVEWSDHVLTAERTVKVNNDLTLIAIFEVDKVNITFTAQNGTAEGAGLVDYGSTITLRAVPADGYRFVQWGDGLTTASRTVTATSDMSFTAQFKLATIFTVNVFAGKGGTVTNGGEIEINTKMNIVATPDKGYHFVRWDDGNQNPSRTYTVTADATFTAEFAPNEYTITTVAFHGIITGGGKADFGTQVTLTAIPEEGYNFVRWDDGITTATRIITVSDDATYTAEFEEAIYNVVLEATNGTVEGAGQCKYNNKVNLSAVADKGYHFVKWSDDNTDDVREIVVTADVKLKAIFEPNKYKITIVAENATISGQGTGEYDYGTTIKTSVRAASGYKFVRWTDGVQTASRSIKVEGDATFTALITSSEVYTVAATAQNGTVEGANNYAEGENATLTATANTGYKFVRWSDGATQAERTVKVDGNLNLTAVFADANSTVYNVTAKANNGSVAGASAYVAGETATLTAQPDNNFKFVRWSDGYTNANRSVKVDADYQVEAVFANANEVVCKVTATAKNGNVTGATNYVSGETAKLEAVADNGYQFVRWSDGATGATRTVKVVSDVNLSALFADAASTIFKVTAKAENGNVSGASNYLQGEVATLTATANDGYKFVRWSDGVTNDTRDVTIKANYTVEAVFAKTGATVCKITATAQNGKVEGASTYFVGEEATLTAVADAGYSFVRWSDGETKETRSFIVEQDSSFTAIFTDKKVYTVAVAAENGTVAGAGKYVSGEAVTLTATPAEGFEFVGWSDSTLVNPYNFKATADILLTAYFQPDSMTVTVIAENGEVTGVGNYVMGDTVVLTAIAAEGYRFVMWSDSVMENPRTIVVASDTTLTALFEVDQTAINEEEAENVNIFAFGNTIVVENAEADIFVYDAMGRLIDRVIPDAGRTEIQIQGVGIHVVKTGNAAKRVMINKR